MSHGMPLQSIKTLSLHANGPQGDGNDIWEEPAADRSHFGAIIEHVTAISALNNSKTHPFD